jgi:hypothetical protein
MRYSTILICFFLLSSCIKEVDFEVDYVPKRLVVNSVMAAYRQITVNVSGLQSIFDDSLPFIENATVIIEEVGGNTDTLQYISKGNYLTKMFCFPGKVYKLMVEAEGYPTAFSCDTVPMGTSIKYALERESSTVDEDGMPHCDIWVTFAPNKGQINYYELFFIDQFATSSGEYNTHLLSLDVSVDPLISASGTSDFNHYTYLFNDAMIEESEYAIFMKMQRAYSGGGIYPQPVIHDRERAYAAVLRTVSKAYYDYRGSWEKHQYFKNDSRKVEDIIYVPLIGEPQEMYSNIENGLGIFVAYSQSYYVLN